MFLVCAPLSVLSTAVDATSSDSTSSLTSAVAIPTVVWGDPDEAAAGGWYPEGRNLSDCVSALPRPGCGSKERGGWRQTLIFASVMTGLLGITGRIVFALRRQSHQR